MKFFKQLYIQVIIGALLGIIVGRYFPEWNETGKMIGEAYINLIKMLIAPLVFFTISTGIAGTGNLGKAGRIGGKAILYFEIVSTLALILGIIIAMIVMPGVGVDPAKINHGNIDTYVKAGQEIKWSDFFIHMIPTNIVDSFAKGDILQVLIFSVLFGVGLSKLGSIGKSLVGNFEKINKVLFSILNIITYLSPLGAFGGMLYTTGKFGFTTLILLGKLMLTFYAASLFFVIVILGLLLRYYKLNIFKLLGFIKEELLIVVGSSSSESVLPNVMQKLETAGCSPTVVGLVIPTGYSFNLDGTSIYLSLSILFIAQVFNIHLGFGQIITIIGILLITSKGAGGITGSGFIVLTASLAAIKIIPVEGLALLLGVDRFMSQCRSITNMIGNTVATVLIAKNEKMIDMDVYNAVVEKKSKHIVKMDIDLNKNNITPQNTIAKTSQI
jgi:aerobic C4-dicarboxylate transport protein